MTHTPGELWNQSFQMGPRPPVCKQRAMNRRRRWRSYVMYCRPPMAMAPRPVPRLLTALVTGCLAFGAGAQEDIRLPDLGSSADALISPQDAQDYGATMLREMRSMDMVVEDPLLDDYLNDLGYRLVAGSDRPKDHFAFFVVKD